MPPVWIVLFLFPILGGAERFNCRTRILGAYYSDAKSGCKAFHVCVRVAGGGVRDFRFFCPPGTLFHQEAQTCTDWGDDDPLACPADLYDGQFDLYKIGSGYDTKKLSSPGNREEEAEFGLQRAETGDRRLSQYNAANNGPSSDLRAAHSSDFFSGQRDRGRDDPAPPAPVVTAARPSAPSRQSFRRSTTPRAPPTTTQYTTQPSPPPPQVSNSQQYDAPSKRKLVRKRPIYVSTAAPTTTYAPTTPAQQFFPQQQQQTFNRIQPQSRQTTPPPASVPPQYKDEYVEVSRVTPKPNRYYPNNPTSAAPFPKSTPAPNFNKKDGLVELYNYETQSTPGFNVQNENRFKVRNSFVVSDVPREDFVRTNANINSNGARNTPTTVDYNTAASRGFATSTPAYRNFNSVSYEPEKNNYVQYSGAKQNYYTSPTTQPTTTTIYTTQRSDRDPPANLNTIAYNTNLAFNTVQPAINYAESNEDDGQYRPPEGEDDGHYRPELYERANDRTNERTNERELLSGAHSLNIAASGNRLPEDQKHHGKSQVHSKPVAHTSVPRPFRPAPTQSVAPPQTTRAPEPTYTTTYRVPTVNTQRTFDYFQTYTTTQRPSELSAQPEAPQAPSNFAPANSAPVRQTTTQAPHRPEPRPSNRAPPPPTIAPSRPTPRPQSFANPSQNREDASYDYAYYDSDPGFSEYDHIEEFGKTKTKA